MIVKYEFIGHANRMPTAMQYNPIFEFFSLGCILFIYEVKKGKELSHGEPERIQN